MCHTVEKQPVGIQERRWGGGAATNGREETGSSRLAQGLNRQISIEKLARRADQSNRRILDRQRN